MSQVRKLSFVTTAPSLGDTKPKLLGKVFISHASADKAFVRKLSAGIEKAGFSTWLDEKELLVGDALATRLSDAIQNSNAVLVVISAASVQSKWLSFELNKATEKMVQGGCRLIPVIKEMVTLPAEVAGLLYADCSTSFKLGLKAIVTALQQDASRLAQNASFWKRCEIMLDRVFDGKGSTSIIREFKDIDYSILITSCSDGEATCAYEIVSGYTNPSRPLSEQWWEEYRAETEDYDEDLFLVVSERPFSIGGQSHPDIDHRIKYITLERGGYLEGYVVLVSLFEIGDEGQALSLLAQAKQLIRTLAGSTGRTLT